MGGRISLCYLFRGESVSIAFSRNNLGFTSGRTSIVFVQKQSEIKQKNPQGCYGNIWDLCLPFITALIWWSRLFSARDTHKTWCSLDLILCDYISFPTCLARSTCLPSSAHVRADTLQQHSWEKLPFWFQSMDVVSKILCCSLKEMTVF